MKKFKQLLGLALALTISASLLAACGQKDQRRKQGFRRKGPDLRRGGRLRR